MSGSGGTGTASDPFTGPNAQQNALNAAANSPGTLTPVYGLTTSGSLAFAPGPFVLPYPGVPALSGTLGANLAVPGGGVSGNVSVGPGGIAGGFSGSVGPVSGGVSIGPGGISGGADINAGPIGGHIGIGPDGSIGGNLGVSIPGLGNAGISVGPGGISGGVNVGIGGLSVNLSASQAAGLTGSLSGGFGPFSFSLAASAPPLMTEDQPGGLFQGPAWGIFDKNNQRIAQWNSVTKVEYKHEYRIADFPIEDGGFASYNKVQMPFDVRISFVVGSGAGGVSTRASFLSALELAVKSLDMYTVITPEAVYKNANLVHMEYSRESRRGVNLLVADVWVQEVRIATGTLTTTQSPTSQAAQNNGQGQAQPAPLQPRSTGGTPDAAGRSQPEPTGAGPSTSPENDMPSQGSGTTTPEQPPPAMPGESVPPVPPTPPPPVPTLPGEPAPTAPAPPTASVQQGQIS